MRLHNHEQPSPSENTPQATLQWLFQALNIAQTAIYEWDVPSGIITWSENTASVLGLDTMQGFTEAEEFESLIAPDARGQLNKKRFTKPARKPTEQDYDLYYALTLPDGRILNVHDTGKQVRSPEGELVKLVGMMMPRALKTKDVMNSALIQSAMEEEYHYPPQFMTALEKALKQHKKEEKETGALIILCIENMPMIVNGWGNDKAEKIVRDIKKAVKEMLYEEDRIFRIQRDQFALICPTTTLEALPERTDNFTTCLKRFGMTATVNPLHVVPTIGYGLFNEAEGKASRHAATNVIDRAYVALKANSMFLSNYQEEDLDSRASSIKQMEMANYIHTAIHHDKLQLAYQPIISAKTGAVVHYECLLRLRNENGELSSAGALIPVAERMGLIDIIDQMVLEMVVEDLLRSPTVSLAFNISNLTTTNRVWLEMFRKVLESTPQIASRMIVEITETAAQRDLKDAAYFVAALQGMGCKVALDDFGSGYTSFRQLKALSCDLIKIDGSFIRDIEKNPDNKFFVKTLLDFTQGFGLESVAEMVETGEAAKILMDLGVEFMQGYYFGKPCNDRVWLNDKKK